MVILNCTVLPFECRSALTDFALKTHLSQFGTELEPALGNQTVCSRQSRILTSLYRKRSMDNICELKLTIFAGMHRIMDRALYLQQAVEGLIGVLAQVVPLSTAAVVLKSTEVRYFLSPASNGSNADSERSMRNLYKTGFDLVFRVPQPFVVLGDNPRPLLLERKTLHSIQKEHVRLCGCPITLGDEVLGVIMVDRLFGDQVPLFEDMQFLSILASFVAQVFSLESQVRRREEALATENLTLRAKLSEEHLGLICMGRSEAARKLESEIRKAAPAEAPVMLLGEPGTGKSSIAQIIHELSGRTAFPFVKLHCFLPEDLLEKDLFGSSAKSFLDDRLGDGLSAFDRAAGGSLLLDEVGELSIHHQIKLLDMVDKLRPARGGAATRPKGLDVRLITTAGLGLPEAVANGSFRKDLQNQLGTLLIHVPSIRERREDIPFLIKHFLDSVCMEQGKKVHFGRRVLKELIEHDWPGNMAEIKNTVIRLVIMADGAEVEPGDLASVFDPNRVAPSVPTGMEGICSMSRLDQMERKEVSAALERNKWIRRKAANDLGLTFRQMNYRVKKFGLDTLIRENRGKTRSSL